MTINLRHKFCYRLENQFLEIIPGNHREDIAYVLRKLGFFTIDGLKWTPLSRPLLTKFAIQTLFLATASWGYSLNCKLDPAMGGCVHIPPAGSMIRD